MTSLKIFEEPAIEFRYGQQLSDPHDGLSLFGPVDADSSSHPKNIIYGVIGTKEGVDAFNNWSKRINAPIVPAEGISKRLWPPFPGFREIFDSVWPEKPSFVHEIERDRLLHASRNVDPNKRAYSVVDEYMNGISLLEKHDESFNLIVCIVPDEVWRNCRPESRIADGWGDTVSKKTRQLRAEGQTPLFDEWAIAEYQHSVDFRRQLKARAMHFNVPLQIIRESTLEINPDHDSERRGLTDMSDRAWNLSTAIYYKSGGKPWKLASAREGVCYIGISFRRTGKEFNSKTACCAAQMFLDSGDGIVFLGDDGPWYSPENKQFHLTEVASKKLLEGILQTYDQLEGKILKEIFLHSRSDISTDEFKGYQKACPNGVKIVGIRVKDDPFIRLFRKGTRPVIRGTFWQINEKTGYLWASGFKSRLATYDGWEVPVPLRIDIQHGKASIEQVSRDIFSLTKLNYNACKLGDSEPVTIGFSNAVGEILISNPKIKERNPKFKFYI
ncbi:MAG: hypothetical protein ABIJ10_01890 [Candidatus Micrarchaeota archaeon]|nr:hypothetical protein [Candidatus Micrarchaeota archaeon]MBU1887348.1 hypothetical protein [Candidatus Micrarchaeota archaeon]